MTKLKIATIGYITGSEKKMYSFLIIIDNPMVTDNKPYIVIVPTR